MNIPLRKELLIPLPESEKREETIVRPRLSYWQDVWFRLRKNKLAMAGLVLVCFFVLAAIIGPFLVPYSYAAQVLSDKSLPPSAAHWLGTDDLGRDMFARVWVGARISLFIGFMAALIDFIIGVVYGGISGLKGGRTDTVMMRVVEVLYGLPYLLMVIMLMVIMGSGLLTIIVAMTVTGWVNMARLVRGEVLRIKEQEFVLAARTQGAGTWHILIRHLVPNAIGPIIVNITLTVPSAIFAEAVLSFLGLGVPVPLASWGTMTNDGLVSLLDGTWWRLFFPALFISLSMFAFNVLGDGLRDALDPRLRK
ncbi:MAG: ABC transporter permease [Desulfitobacteriaceae bacterium]